MSPAPEETAGKPRPITLFLCGDVMTGRGIDQVLPHPGDPRIHEPYMQSAAGYVALAEQANGLIPKPVGFSYIWGDALEELARVRPDVRIINLETAVTRSNAHWPLKGIHYRMHPDNVLCLSAAGIDCCALANNHVLDWGYVGLTETIETLERAGLKHAGAGRDIERASAPAVMEVAGKGRVLVFSMGTPTSGIPWDWAAGQDKPGVKLLQDFSDETVRRIAQGVRAVKRTGDIAVASIHWGGNWGYTVPQAHCRFAHQLIDQAAIDVIHGHSSHHPMGIEVYRGKPILYGCGDFLNDYEGISGYEEFRAELTLMYFLTMDTRRGKLLGLTMTPMRVQRFRENRASAAEARWLRETLNRESKQFGVGVDMDADNRLVLRWGRRDS